MTTQLNSIETLTSSNYKKWKQDVEIVLGLMDLDFALTEQKPTEPITTSIADEKAKYDKWMKANKLSLMIIKRSISNHIKGAIKDNGNVKDFLSAIKQKLLEFDKVEIGITITDNFLVHQSLRSLPKQFNQLKTTYDAQKKKWSVDELITVCVVEEGRIQKEKVKDVVNFVSSSRSAAYPSYKRKGQSHNLLGPQDVIKKEIKCWDCKQVGHKKASCPLKKKSGNLLTFVCFETSLVHVPLNSWWLDSGATVHVTNDLQDLVSRRKPKEDEASVVMGNGLKAKENILPVLDPKDFETCVDCVKGKMTKVKRKGSTRSSELLEIIHTDINGTYVPTLINHKYFITFIDDFSRYCYIYLLKEKSEALAKFKIYKTEVEKQFGKSIKIVRSDRGGEYYGIYDDSGQCMGPFALILQECGIVAQYTMPGTPEQNGVAERRNHTLIEMVRSMMSRTSLPESLCGKTLKIASYILTRVPTKSVLKTPFELWTTQKPSLNHFHIWGCPAEVPIYSPTEKKTDPKTTSCLFIGYPDHSKGFRFFYPGRGTRIVESINSKFLEHDVCDCDCSCGKEIILKENEVIVLVVHEKVINQPIYEGENQGNNDSDPIVPEQNVYHEPLRRSQK
ncbi:uncharacterized protein [Nicotiana sylvestris]|uniref:uncharacterized protein n=1 Tax=Nicotiana sylvestris TaxID=4096 RepID=UPI00388C455A